MQRGELEKVRYRWVHSHVKYKMYHWIDFDYSVLVQTDKNTEAEYYTKLLTNGVLTINDVRSKLGFEPSEEVGSNNHWIQISYATVENVASGAYIKQTEQTQGQKVDNKVKQDEVEEPKKKSKKKTEE